MIIKQNSAGKVMILKLYDKQRKIEAGNYHFFVLVYQKVVDFFNLFEIYLLNSFKLKLSIIILSNLSCQLHPSVPCSPDENCICIRLRIKTLINGRYDTDRKLAIGHTLDL